MRSLGCWGGSFRKRRGATRRKSDAVAVRGLSGCWCEGACLPGHLHGLPGCPAAPAGPRRLRSRLPRAACRRALGRSREVHGIAVSQVRLARYSHCCRQVQSEIWLASHTWASLLLSLSLTRAPSSGNQLKRILLIPSPSRSVAGRSGVFCLFTLCNT